MPSTSDPLYKLYAATSALGDQPECKTCRRCEDPVGLVYLLSSEASVRHELRLPVVEATSAASYVPRTSTCHCLHFEATQGRCLIYDRRPLCCRIYPIDLIRFADGDVQWVLHAECPIAQRWATTRTLDIPLETIAALESELTIGQVEEWIAQERFSKSVETMFGSELKLIKMRPIDYSRLRPATRG